MVLRDSGASSSVYLTLLPWLSRGSVAESSDSMAHKRSYSIKTESRKMAQIRGVLASMDIYTHLGVKCSRGALKCVLRHLGLKIASKFQRFLQFHAALEVVFHEWRVHREVRQPPPLSEARLSCSNAHKRNIAFA